MPSLPNQGEGNKSESDIEVIDQIKTVSDYCNCSIQETLNLSFDVFALCLKKAIIKQLNSSEKGRKYLNDCDNINKTEMDEEAVDKFLGGGV